MRKLFCLIIISLVLFSCAKKEEAQQIVDKTVQDVTGITTIRQGQKMVEKLNQVIETGNSKLQEATQEEGIE